MHRFLPALALPALLLASAPGSAQTPTPATPAEPDAVIDLDGSKERPSGEVIPAGSFALLPEGLDRSSWSLPPGSPAPTDDLALWDADRFRCVVADGFEGDPRAEPSVTASLEAALRFYDE
ncbi:hypothetical protein [Phycisphaera mikurensis]|uniref:Uncharacterized protein n=1 Tax=Phycisphaera mikurensis (strain NBRC 102666 / KCTC 22515 / FYK2301M01) TaxID=1142394 RepID=I0IEE0_PHYMF|nr:hypothetical protein [Phycisphaera mikurensis]MBB6441428.1 hypothetical protein [Phycisphaera mikurensis]BAM03628.1 hypothetical protein PSMK_14690 [Phycisphaera mikurensis NBRC 102666]